MKYQTGAFPESLRLRFMSYSGIYKPTYNSYSAYEICVLGIPFVIEGHHKGRNGYVQIDILSCGFSGVLNQWYYAITVLVKGQKNIAYISSVGISMIRDQR